jgi:hypothetical protein
MSFFSQEHVFSQKQDPTSVAFHQVVVITTAQWKASDTGPCVVWNCDHNSLIESHWHRALCATAIPAAWWKETLRYTENLFASLRRLNGFVVSLGPHAELWSQQLNRKRPLICDLQQPNGKRPLVCDHRRLIEREPWSASLNHKPRVAAAWMCELWFAFVQIVARNTMKLEQGLRNGERCWR